MMQLDDVVSSLSNSVVASFKTGPSQLTLDHL